MVHLSRRGKLRPAINLKNIIKAHTTHGLSHHPLYKVWNGIKQRCFNPKCEGYKDYGGRGITMCKEWVDSFEIFFIDVVKGYKKGLQLDRVNNDGNYEARNVRWATRKQQMGNTRQNNYIEYDGTRMILQGWADILEVNSSVLYNYMKKYSFEKAYFRYSNKIKKHKFYY